MKLYEAHVYHPMHGTDYLMVLGCDDKSARVELDRRLKEEFPYPFENWIIDYITPV